MSTDSPFRVPTTFASSPLETMTVAVHYAAGRFGVTPDCILCETKSGRLLIHDRPHDDDGARVVKVLRPSRTGSGLWFEVEGRDVVGMHDLPRGTWRG